MPITTTLAACNTNPALNGPAGTDLPSDLDDGLRYALSFIALLRDGAGTPTGAMMQFPTTTAPAGFLKMNGQLVSRTTYATLFAFATAVGLVSEATWSGGQSGSFAVGDGSTTFRLPDLRGLFVRGLDESRGVDVSRVMGVFQDHTNVQHTHTMSDPTHVHVVNDPQHLHGGTALTAGNHAHTYTAPLINTTVNAGSQANVAQEQAAATNTTGNHTHDILTDSRSTGITLFGAGTGITAQNQGATDGHPRNQAYPFYIKF